MTNSATATAAPLYHYTAPAHLPRIVQAGFLRLTESNVSLTQAHAGRDVLWLTTDANAGGSHGLSIGMNVPGTLADKTRVRFTVYTPDAVPWLESEEYAAMDPRFRSGIIRAGGGAAAARTWWVAYEPVPRAHWIAVHADGKPLPLGGTAFGSDRLAEFAARWA